MARWTCPRCDREFDRSGQSHTCVPGGSVADTFAGKPEPLRAAYDVLLAHLRGLGPVHEDAVTVGVFLKNERKFAELRPSSRSLQIAFAAPRPIHDPRLRRPYPAGGGRIWHLTRVRGPDEVDEPLLDWLAEAYDEAGGPPPPAPRH